MCCHLQQSSSDVTIRSWIVYIGWWGLGYGALVFLRLGYGGGLGISSLAWISAMRLRNQACHFEIGLGTWKSGSWLWNRAWDFEIRHGTLKSGRTLWYRAWHFEIGREALVCLGLGYLFWGLDSTFMALTLTTRFWYSKYGFEILVGFWQKKLWLWYSTCHMSHVDWKF